MKPDEKKQPDPQGGKGEIKKNEEKNTDPIREELKLDFHDTGHDSSEGGYDTREDFDGK